MRFNKIYLASFLSLLIGFTSCSEGDLYLEEVYEKITYIVSGENNILEVDHELTGETTTAYITVGVSGSTPAEEDIKVTLEVDTAAVLNYNLITYLVDTISYAKDMIAEYPERLNVPTYSATIKAGTKQATIPIEVDVEGLSVDTTYFLPFKVQSTSIDTVNPEKSNILYRVMFENEYASQSTLTSYQCRGAWRYGEGGNDNTISTTKNFYPVYKNGIRTMAANQTLSEDYTAEEIAQKCIVIEFGDVQEDGTTRELTVKPYNDSYARAENVELEGYNVALTDRYGFEKFYINYRCQVKSDPAAEWDPNAEWIYVKEAITITTAVETE